MRTKKRLLWACLAGILVASATIASEGLVAQGDGFVISRQDLSDVQVYFSEKGFETTDREYVNGALKLFLFAEEAAASGLAAKPDAVLSGKEKVGRLFQIHKLYASHLLENHPVSDEAIVSYYLAYPEKFTGGKSMKDKEHMQVDELDKEKKEWIRYKILAAKKSRLMESEFRRLKEKYHVRLSMDNR